MVLVSRRTVAFAALFAESQVAPVVRIASLEIVPFVVAAAGVVVVVAAAAAAAAVVALAVAVVPDPVCGHRYCRVAVGNLAAAMAGSYADDYAAVGDVLGSVGANTVPVDADFAAGDLTAVGWTRAFVELALVVGYQIAEKRVEKKLACENP